MADSVFFDGVDDKMVFGIGNAAITGYEVPA